MALCLPPIGPEIVNKPYPHLHFLVVLENVSIISSYSMMLWNITLALWAKVRRKISVLLSELLGPQVIRRLQRGPTGHSLTLMTSWGWSCFLFQIRWVCYHHILCSSSLPLSLGPFESRALERWIPTYRVWAVWGFILQIQNDKWFKI